MTEVVFKFHTPEGLPKADTEFTITLTRLALNDEHDCVVIPQTYARVTNAEGEFVLDLEPVIAPYRMTYIQPADEYADEQTITRQFYVPDVDTPVYVQDLLLNPPPTSLPWDEESIAAITQIKGEAVAAADRASAEADRAAAVSQGVEQYVDLAKAAAAESAESAVLSKNSADEANAAVGRAQEVVDSASGLVAEAKGYADSAKETLEEVNAAAESVGTTVQTVTALRDETATLRDESRQAAVVSDSRATDAETARDVSVAAAQASADEVAKAAAEVTKAHDEAERAKGFADSITGAVQEATEQAQAATVSADRASTHEQGAQQAVTAAEGYAEAAKASAESIDISVFEQRVSSLETGKVDKVAGKGLSTNDFTDEDKEAVTNIGTAVTQQEAEQGTLEDIRRWSPLRVRQSNEAWWLNSPSKAKLDAIAPEATKNSADSFLLDRANQTGTQAINTVTGLEAALENKVVKEEGKVLSSNDFTNTEKTKLGTVQDNAQVNPTQVTQPVAEAGTATVVAGWSAQNVRQSTVAWWTASAAKNKLDGITAGAEVNAVLATQAEAEAGTVTTVLSWSPQRVHQAVAAWWGASAHATKLNDIAAGAQVNYPVATEAQAGDKTGTVPLTWTAQRIVTLVGSGGGDAARVGDVLRTGNVAPENYLRLNGGTYLQSAYPELFNLIGLLGSDQGLTWANAGAGNNSLTTAVSDMKGVIIALPFQRSLDNGATWVASGVSSANNLATDTLGVWISMNGNAAARSLDNGATWTSITGVNSGFSIDSNNAGTWLATGNVAASKLMRSTDNGNTWSLVANSPFTTLSNYVVHDKKDRWYMFGAQGIAYSIDDGFTWTIANSSVPFGSAIARSRSLAIDDAGNCMFATANNNIAISRDRGVTWTVAPASIPGTTSIGAVVALDVNKFMTVAANNFWYTEDLGTSWSQRTVPSSPPATGTFATKIKDGGMVIAGTVTTGVFAAVISRRNYPYDPATQFKLPVTVDNEGIRSYIKAKP